MLSLLAVLMTFGSASATTFDVSKGTPLNVERALDKPTSIEIENPLGNVVVEEAPDEALLIDGTFDGQSVQVHLDESTPGKFVLKVERPSPSLTSIGDIEINGGGSVKISNISARNINIGNITAGGGKVQIENASVIVGESKSLHLRVRVPRNKLQNLTVRAPLGNVEVKGAFAGRESATRRVDLRAGSGVLLCTDIHALGSFYAESKHDSALVRDIVIGEGTVKTAHDLVRAVGVVGNLKMESEGEISWEDGRGHVTVEGRHKKIALTGRDLGNVVVRAVNADVAAIGGTGSTDVRTGLGRTEIRGRSQDFIEVNTKGRVDIEDAAHDVRIDGYLEPIDLGLTGSGTVVVKTRASVKIRGGEGDLRVENDLADVTVENHRMGPTEVNSRGGIRVTGSSGKLTLKTKFNVIEVAGHSNGAIDARTNNAKIVFNNPDPSVTEFGETKFADVHYTDRSGEDCGPTFTR